MRRLCVRRNGKRSWMHALFGDPSLRNAYQLFGPIDLASFFTKLSAFGRETATSSASVIFGGPSRVTVRMPVGRKVGCSDTKRNRDANRELALQSNIFNKQSDLCKVRVKLAMLEGQGDERVDSGLLK